MKQKLINKLLSARFWIAILTTIVFSVLAITGTLTVEFISIYTIIIAFYFNKKEDSHSNNDK